MTDRRCAVQRRRHSKVDFEILKFILRQVQGGQARRKGVYFCKWLTADTQPNAEDTQKWILKFVLRWIQGGQVRRKGVYFCKWLTADTQSNAEDAQKKRKNGGIAQLARASALQAEGRRFDSDYLHWLKFIEKTGSTSKQSKKVNSEKPDRLREIKKYTKKSLILAQDER